MQILYDILIFLGVGIVMSLLTTLFVNFLLPGNTVVYIENDEVRKKFYHLSKSKIFFFGAFLYHPIFWKKGWILKRTVWAVLATYLYYLLGLAADLIYYFVTKTFLIDTHPIAFILMLVGGFAALVIATSVMAGVIFVREKRGKRLS